MKENDVTSEFTDRAAEAMEKNLPRISKCMELLSESETWQRPNEASNSVANLILHLCGNITQYIISALGGEEDRRERDREFSLRTGYTRRELMKMLEATVRKAVEIIKTMKEEDLLRVRSVQGSDYTGLAIVLHVAEHLSYHTGQIAFYTKLLRGAGLGFYAGKDLNKRNG